MYMIMYISVGFINLRCLNAYLLTINKWDTYPPNK